MCSREYYDIAAVAAKIFIIMWWPQFFFSLLLVNYDVKLLESYYLKKKLIFLPVNIMMDYL